MKSLLLALALLGAPVFADIAPEPAPPAEPTPPAPPAPAPAPSHPQGIEKAMGSGVIQGGWEYVYAAYILGAVGVLGYAASLYARRPKPSENAP